MTGALNLRSSRAQTGASQPGLVRPKGDLFVTSPEATQALLKVEDFPGIIWEPACGDGTMARELERGRNVSYVIASDIFDHGCPNARSVDFLDDDYFIEPRPYQHIVTNPPYDQAEAFVQRALGLNPQKVAMLLRTVWLEGIGRHSRLWSKRPPARVWVFSKRPTFKRGGEGEFQSGLISFSWYVWEKSHVGPPQLGWLP